MQSFFSLQSHNLLTIPHHRPTHSIILECVLLNSGRIYANHQQSPKIAGNFILKVLFYKSFLCLQSLSAANVNSEEGSVIELLLSTTSAANTRAQEATLLFQNIACVLDNAIIQNENLLRHLKKHLYNFVAVMNSVACRHVDCHVRGTPRPPTPYSHSTVLNCIHDSAKSYKTSNRQTPYILGERCIHSSKCANCHSPHSADSLECVIRPREDNTLTGKAQMAVIRQAARIRLKVAHCGLMGGQVIDSVPGSSNQTQVPETQPAPQTPSADRRIFTESHLLSKGKYAALDLDMQADNVEENNEY